MSVEAYSAIEAQIRQAIERLKGEGKPNVATMAPEFEVPKERLRARWNGRQSRAE